MPKTRGLIGGLGQNQTISIIGSALLLCFLPSLIAKASTVVLFRGFNDVVYLPPAGLSKELGIGWVREAFYWDDIEPRKGKWEFENTDRIVTEAQAQGLEVLPLLGYTARWSASVSQNIFSPPQRTSDWENFVEHVVARYSNPPFNLRYFQIWNEPTRQAKFWFGSDTEFVDAIYLPAARIIRRHHCYVVFGGWPASNNLPEFDSVLEYHDAWRWTDFLDIHYEGLSDWQYLYDRWVKTRKCKGVWETELGFTNDPDFIPETYLSMLHWSLVAGWKNPNAYKLFWYAVWGAGADGPNCLTQTNAKDNAVLSDQGKRLAVLSQLFDTGPLTVFSDFRVTPLPPNSSALGFKCGRRIVIALFLDKKALANAPFVRIGILINKKPSTVSLIDEDGQVIKFDIFFHKRYLTVKTPTQPSAQSSRRLAIEYLEVDPS